MHTSLTSYTRIYFVDVANPDYLADLCQELGLEHADNYTYDLIIDEGSELTLDTVLRIALCREPSLRDGLTIKSMVDAVRKILAIRNIVPVSHLFRDETADIPGDGQDIRDAELFDVLTALSTGMYCVAGIFSQWAVTSNRNAFGANYGGTNITTKDFCIPCSIQACDAEDTIMQLWAMSHKAAGSYIAQRFITPLIQSPSIVNKALSMSVQAALAQSFADIFGGSINEPEKSGADRAVDQFNDATIRAVAQRAKDKGIEIPEIKGVNLKGSTSK